MRGKLELSIGLALLVSAVAAVGCSGRRDSSGDRSGAAGGGAARGSGGSLTIKGSDTMVILAQRWAEKYMEEHPGTSVQVSGGGSGTGIAALINGTTDIATASRPIKDREKEQVRQRRSADAHETRVALDAITVYVHNDNPVRTLTIEQLHRIYRGHVTRWSEVGGPDRRIILYSRENSSGTYAYFKEHVLDDLDFSLSAQTLPGTSAVINAVSRDPGGIGYGGIAYAQGVHALKIAPEGEEPVEPSLANAVSGQYPLARYLNLYTIGEPRGLVADFIEFALSPAGQELVEGVGYYPMPSDDES